MTVPPRNVLESLNKALHGMMQRDKRVHLVGEDVLDPYGGAFKVANGLSTNFPDRVWTTPISESAIVGMGVGMALRGLRPVVEIMFGDFLTLAADQIINHAAKFRWMFNDMVRVPLVVRTPMGGRRGYGATHSQSLEKHFLGVPGLWVVAPSVFGDPGRLLEQATLECDDPVLFIESKTCYGRPLFETPEGMRGKRLGSEVAPFPTWFFSWPDAAPDGLFCCYGAMAPILAEATRSLAETEGLYCDLAVFTQLSPTPTSHLSWLLERRPPVCVLAEEASSMAGWSAEMGAAFQEQCAEHDDHDIQLVRVGALHEPIGSGSWIEQHTLPQVEDVVTAMLAQF
jgi:pyruvate/2-oxoglutarate/acetoin dehydrogenase E1 component